LADGNEEAEAFGKLSKFLRTSLHTEDGWDHCTGC